MSINFGMSEGERRHAADENCARYRTKIRDGKTTHSANAEEQEGLPQELELLNRQDSPVPVHPNGHTRRIYKSWLSSFLRQSLPYVFPYVLSAP